MLLKPTALAIVVLALLSAAAAALVRDGGPSQRLRRLGAGPAADARTERRRISMPRGRPWRGSIRPASTSAATSPLPTARERQRRLMTAFALEIAALGSRKHAAAAARLIEWACPYVRSHTPINDFDRAWQLAALAVLEGGIDSAALHAHLDHVAERLRQRAAPRPRARHRRRAVRRARGGPDAFGVGRESRPRARGAGARRRRTLPRARARDRAVPRRGEDRQRRAPRPRCAWGTSSIGWPGTTPRSRRGTSSSR